MLSRAHGHSLTGAVVLFAEQIFKNDNEIRFAPPIVCENTRDILRLARY